MNRLRGSRGYLCGPMDRVSDGGIEWRVNLRDMTTELGIKWLDPCDKPIQGFDETSLRVRIHEAKAVGDWDEVTRLIKPIRCVDLRMIDVSDFIVAKLDAHERGCGTYEEITTANRQKKPVIIWCPQGKAEIPNWMFAMLPHRLFFRDLDEVVGYLWHVAHDDVVEHLRRWYFFDYGRV